MSPRVLLVVGDVVAIMVVTLVGFATHRELGTAPVNRLLATFVPLLIGWALAAPWMGLFDPSIAANPRMLWRSALAMALAGPLAAFLRGATLNSVILPLFVAVLTGSAALGMVLWRALWVLLNRRRRPGG